MAFEANLDPETARAPITAASHTAARLRGHILSQISQAGQCNGLVDLSRTLIDPVNPNQWFEDQLKGISPQELREQLLGMQRIFGRISQSLKERVAWFRSRIEDVVDEKELHTAVNVRIGHFLQEWIERLEDVDFAALSSELENASSLPIAERQQLAERVYRDLCELVRQREIFTEDYDSIRYDDAGIKRERLTPDRLLNLRGDIQLSEHCIRNSRAMRRSHGRTSDIVENIRHIRREGEIRSNIRTVDHTEIERDAEQYGAKGANLLAAKKVLGGLNKSMELGRVRIPRFTLLNVELFEQWKRGEDLTEALRGTHQWIGGKAMYIRSSAVHSEDRENITGAGIYDSIPLPKAASFDEFRAAVEQVYGSVDAPKAVEYRALNGITTSEQMGLVVQEKVADRLQERRKGYINTVRPYAPGLLEIVSEDELPRCICEKDAIERQMWCGDRDLQHIAYYQLDLRRHSGASRSFTTLAHVGQLLEMHFGYPVQVEFIGSGFYVNILQVRHLPKHLLRTAAVNFPEGKPLHESDAIGVGDTVLDVLPPDRNNGERKGVVIFYRSYGMSEHYIEQYLPKEGAVIILCRSNENFGHIETLCVERGLLCVFNSSGRPQGESEKELSPALRTMFEQVQDHRISNFTRYNDFAGHPRLHIVADGLHARIYPAEATEDPS